MKIEFLKRPLAFTDLETTGDDPFIHEIIEIGLVLTNQLTLEIIDNFETKVKPVHIETALEIALEKNGYNEKDWQDALTLKEGMGLYANKTRSSILFAQNVTFDWSFLSHGFHQTGIKNEMGYQRLDLLSMAYEKLKPRGLRHFKLDNIAQFLGIPPEPLPHRAINGAKTLHEVYKKLRTI